MNETVQITQAELKRLGYWEDARKRFNLNDSNVVVTLKVGTTLYRDHKPTVAPPPLACALCGTQMVPMTVGGKSSEMCPVCAGGADTFRP